MSQPPQSANRNLLGKVMPPLYTIGVLLLLWIGVTSKLGDRPPIVAPISLPTPLAVAQTMRKFIFDGELWPDITKTLTRLLAALLFAIGLGVPAGLLLGHFRKAFRFVELPLHALRSVPSAALFPMLLIVIGVGEASIITLAAYSSLLIILISTASGARLANPLRLYQAKLLGLNGWQVATKVVFWESLPHTLAGIRVAQGYALALVIAVEMFIGIGNEGLGRKIYDFQSAYRIPETYAAILIAGLIGVLLNLILSRCERYLLRWLPKQHEESAPA